MQGGYVSNRGSGGSLKSGQAFISTRFSLCLFGNEPCFTRSSLSSLTDLSAFAGIPMSRLPVRGSPQKEPHKVCVPWGWALLLEVSRVLKHHVHREGLTCPLLARCPPLPPGLQGHVLATTSAPSFVSGKQIKGPSCASCDSARLSSRGAECSYTPHPSPTPPQIRQVRHPSKDTQKQMHRNT